MKPTREEIARVLHYVKARTRERSVKGTRCPVCRRPYKIYCRKTTETMVALLFRLTGLYLEKRRWIHRNRFMALAQCGDFARFRHYGFVRQKTNDDEDKKDSGLWKPTQDGMSFLLGETAIHTHMLCRPPSLYIIDTSTPKRFVRDFVGKKFSYAELINEVPQHYRKDAK